MRGLDDEYDALMDELEAAVDEVDAVERGHRIRTVRIRIEDLLREQMGLAGRVPPADRRHGPYALN